MNKTKMLILAAVLAMPLTVNAAIISGWGSYAGVFTQAVVVVAAVVRMEVMVFLMAVRQLLTQGFLMIMEVRKHTVH